VLRIILKNTRYSNISASAGEGVRGVILADPCFQSEWIVCVYQTKFSTFERTTTLLNAINAHDDVSYFQILGDNFYDQAGEATSQWFAALSDQSKSKVFATVPGNHDYWVSPPKTYH
jgi:Calcineurin-like phosphoesterase